MDKMTNTNTVFAVGRLPRDRVSAVLTIPQTQPKPRHWHRQHCHILLGAPALVQRNRHPMS